MSVPGGNRRARKAPFDVTMAINTALSAAFDMSAYAAIQVWMPAEWTTADLGLKVSPTEDGTYVPLKDSSNGYGTNVSIDGAVAAVSYLIPLHSFAGCWVKLWSHNGSGVDVNQAAARTFTVVLKS